MRLTLHTTLLVASCLSVGVVACGDDDSGMSPPANSAGSAGSAGVGQSGSGGGSGTGGTSAGSGGTSAGSGGTSAGSGGSSAGSGGSSAGSGGSSAGSGGSSAGSGGSSAGSGGMSAGSGGSSAGSGGAAAGTGGSAGAGGKFDPATFSCEVDSTTAVVTEAELDLVIDAYCSRPASCCNFSDKAICQKVYGGVLKRAPMRRGANADACLAALANANGACDLPASCEQDAFVPSFVGAAPGEPCGGAVECASCQGVSVSCSASSKDGATTRVCVASGEVGLGETCDGQSSTAVVRRECADGLFCDAEFGEATGKCTTKVETPPSCPAALSAEVSAFLQQSVDANCAQYVPCCEAGGLQGGGAICQALLLSLGSITPRPYFDAARATQCLAKLQAAPSCQASGFSFSFGSGLADEDADDNLCDRVYENPAAAPAGGTCTAEADCQMPDLGSVTCTKGVCLQRVPGQEGDACLRDLDGDNLPATSAICQPKDGLFCDSDTKLCAKRRPVGGACDREGACESGRCAAGKCVARVADGAACTADAECLQGSWCTGGACAAQLPNGTACTLSASCVGGACVNGKCAQELGFSGAFFCH
jgi:hypothetical protein